MLGGQRGRGADGQMLGCSEAQQGLIASVLISRTSGGHMFKRIAGTLIAAFIVIFLTGCGGITHYIVSPDSQQYAKDLDFKVIKASATTDHLIQITVLIDNETDGPVPFTPSQAYLSTSGKKVIFSGLPQKQGYTQLPPITTTTARIGNVAATATSGPSLGDVITNLVENAKTQEWNSSVEETITPCYIPAHTILQGHLWFKWTKMHTVVEERDPLSEKARRDILSTPVTLHIISPEKELLFNLALKNSVGIYY